MGGCGEPRAGQSGPRMRVSVCGLSLVLLPGWAGKEHGVLRG